MLNIHTLVLGLYQVNCYVVHNADSDRCVVIDPGYSPNEIAAFLRKRG
jgi:glyoxylase-like metal-dependent hydrolase (beta-lactamase superfamily II)